MHTLILHTLQFFSRVLLCTELFYIPPFHQKNQNMNGRHFINFIVKHHVLRTSQCIVLHENLKITRTLVSRITATIKLLKICLSNRLIDDEIFSAEKRCPVAILSVNISLSTVTSSTVTPSKFNVENSAKARYVNETYSYHLLKYEINKSNQRIFTKTMFDHGKLCKTLSKYIKKKGYCTCMEYILLTSFFWPSCPRKLVQLFQKNSFNTIYSHTSAITYNIAYFDITYFRAFFTCVAIYRTI